MTSEQLDELLRAMHVAVAQYARRARPTQRKKLSQLLTEERDFFDAMLAELNRGTERKPSGTT